MELYYIPILFYFFICSRFIFGHLNYFLFLFLILSLSNIFYYYIFNFILYLTSDISNNFINKFQILIPPRWIEIATGNFYYWISYIFIYFFYGDIILSLANMALILYLHFVDILWLCIDWIIYVI